MRKIILTMLYSCLSLLFARSGFNYVLVQKCSYTDSALFQTLNECASCLKTIQCQRVCDCQRVWSAVVRARKTWKVPSNVSVTYSLMNLK